MIYSRSVEVCKFLENIEMKLKAHKSFVVGGIGN